MFLRRDGMVLKWIVQAELYAGKTERHFPAPICSLQGRTGSSMPWREVVFQWPCRRMPPPALLVYVGRRAPHGSKYPGDHAATASDSRLRQLGQPTNGRRTGRSLSCDANWRLLAVGLAVEWLSGRRLSARPLRDPCNPLATSLAV